jgi:hypothetical protein
LHVRIRTLLDVRRDSERAGGFIDGSVHIPIHELHGRISEVPGAWASLLRVRW